MSLESLVTILGMAAITYAIRAGGLLLANRLPTSGFVATWMRHIPGAVLASLGGPTISSGGIAEGIGAAVVALTFLVTRNLFAAMVGGVFVVYLARTYLVG